MTDQNLTSHPDTNQTIERIILANPISNVSPEQMADVIESGRVLITGLSRVLN